MVGVRVASAQTQILYLDVVADEKFEKLLDRHGHVEIADDESPTNLLNPPAVQMTRQVRVRRQTIGVQLRIYRADHVIRRNSLYGVHHVGRKLRLRRIKTCKNKIFINRPLQ